MRVLHVSGGQVYGGIERMLSTFAATRSDAVTQQFCVLPQERLWRELLEAGARCVALPPARASRPLSVLTARRTFARQLAELQPDATIFHGSWTHAMFAPAARAGGTLVAFWQHAPIRIPHWPDRWAARTQPDILIANSRFTSSSPAFADVPNHVIHCPVASVPPVPADDRRRLRAVAGVRDTDVVVLMAARLEAWKGHAVLIDAAKRLGNENIRIWIAGGVQRPEERAYFAQLSAQISRSHVGGVVSLLGERADVQALMALADLYCQPNVAPEPFGLAIAEAMRAGLPCVVSNLGGAAELVDETCGVLAAPGDAAAVATALTRLASDSASRHALGSAAARRASQLTDPPAKLRELAAVLSVQTVHV